MMAEFERLHLRAQEKERTSFSWQGGKMYTTWTIAN